MRDAASPEGAPMSREAQLAALFRSPILADLPPAELEAIHGLLRAQEVPAGATIAREGEPGNELFFVLSGLVRLWRADLALQPLGPGGHFGELSLLTGRPRAASAVAEVPSLVASLDRAAWERIRAERPATALSVLSAIVLHLRDELVDRTDSLSLLLRGRTLPRERELTVQVEAERRRVPTGTPLGRLLPAMVDGAQVVAGLLGQRPVSLATPLTADCSVAPLPETHWEGRLLYARSAGLALLEAAYELDPQLVVRMGPSLGTAQVLELPEGQSVTERARLAADLDAGLRRLIARDEPFRHELWTTDEAIDWFGARGWDDAARLLRSRREGTVALASCGRVYAVGMGPMLPSTGRLRPPRILQHDLGLLLDFGDAPPAAGQILSPGDGERYREHRSWLAGMGITSVGAFNDVCVSGQVAQLVRVAEGFHEKRLGQIADAIAAARDRLRVIAIAGPSSSGKTTFIKRLTVQLLVAGLHPVGLSLDDYYVDRVRTPRDAKGDFDFEALEALDLPLLQDHVGRIVRGEAVQTARYDFKTGRSAPAGGPLIQLRRGDVLVMEGIHGLNPALLGDIPRPGEQFSVFLQPVTTLSLDRVSRVSASDLRLLRRIVRDRHHRGYLASENIARWPAVLEGERRHIFPFRDRADASFDSALVYETAVLKVYAERYLLEVPPEHPTYGTAWRLRTLIDRFVTIYPDHVPPTSILREFIGGSGFEY